jgi:ubiquinone/menaquinone biosynthesis C-methylase UbiE
VVDHVCPPWVGRLLLNPLRKLVENPKKMLDPFVSEGMVVLEPGCAMGFFTLPLAQMVGEEGRVIAVDIQPEMLATLERRARKTGLIDRIDIRKAGPNGLGVDDLVRSADLCTLIHVAHEVPDRNRLFHEISNTLKTGGRLLVIEPGWHVSEEDFKLSLSAAGAAGLRRIETPDLRGRRKALFERVEAQRR